MRTSLQKLLIFSFTWLMFFACTSLKEPSNRGDRSRKEVEVIVANHKVNCTGVAPQMCYLIKLNEEDEWSNYYNELEGFDYEEGYEYRIKVKMEHVSNSYKDAKDYKYHLIEVISKVEKPVVISPLYDSWGLLEINGRKIEVQKLNRSPMMDINTRKKRVLASTGCNSYSTSIDFNDDSGYFKFTFPFPISEMACQGYNIESEYLLAIEKVNSFEIKGVDLYFKEGNKILLHFRKVD